ncbi:hypothetical protein GALMADRAFT_222809 [Galerina marginata CBS 339.88]|uniref:1-phosphatidylinositol-4-phosphate 5-kinase n=1 Tax=Galerina marginata (strain CBS 339.88) TaxID=685588 RepID=A0A067T9J0_GALM3|nr:hypothetical protein GALMADRAFT_222809 [Galerina marginata CBS 339.88]
MASAAILIHQPRRSPSPSTANKNELQRQSLLSNHSLITSSPTSYRTAPLTAGSRTSLALSTSSHSSVHTISATVRESNAGNPTYGLPQEVHIVKVTNDTVQIEPGTVPDSYFEKIGKSVICTIQPESDHAGPPPPSPPASIDDQLNEGLAQAPTRMLYNVQSDPTPVRNDVDTTTHDRQASASPSRFNNIRILAPQPALQRSSTDTKASYPAPRTIITHPSPQLQSEQPNAEASSSTPSRTHLSVDGYLQPPSLSSQRPTRRNTTGSTPQTPKRVGTSPHGKGASQPFNSTDDAVLGEGGLELASDIELHAERIRRERFSKRAKQQEAEAALTRAESSAAGGVVQDTPLVGNLIGEDHVNYVLMYNMLTGIRIAVSRCQAKPKRPLSDEDFPARHKFSFDIVGNELTPSAKYDFKFKDYAPWVFRYLREDIFHLDPADYLLSLTAKYILSELGSPGKSGSFFYFSRDYRFIIKTIHHSEHKFLLSVLKQYYDYVKENPHTLLSRFYGLHRVKLPHGRKIHFVIMNNLFPAHKDIHETYDLKGSTVGREYSEEKAARNPRAVLKDLNWINRGNMLELGPEKRALLTEQLRRDEEFLKSIHVMDYSLLVGIHNMHRGNRENVRKNTLKVFSPILPETRRTKLSQSGKSPEAIAMRRAMRSSDPKRLGKHTIRLPEEDTGDRQEFVFYQDEGGLRATDDNNDPMNTIYYLGVIDILTPYTFFKKVEHVWKGMKADRHKISPVPPPEYGNRFFSFMKAIMRGGEGGEKFKEKSKDGGEKSKEE